MFEDTLLDSSPSNAPVLKGIHWLIGFAAGVVAFGAGYFGLGFLGGEGSALIVQSVVLGVLLRLFTS